MKAEAIQAHREATPARALDRIGKKKQQQENNNTTKM